MSNITTMVYDVSEENYREIEFFLFILESLGFRLYRLKKISLDELNKGTLFLIAAKAFEEYTKKEIKLIRKAVHEGKRLLILLDSDSAPFFDSSQKLLEDAGILITNMNIVSEDGSATIVTSNLNKKHRVTTGIRSLVLVKPKVLLIAQKRLNPIEVLVRSEREHNPPDAIIGATTRIGNGRVAVISSWSIIENDVITKEDNSLFILVLLHWLIGKQVQEGLLEKLAKLISAGKID